MKIENDLSKMKSRKNPYASKLKESVSSSLDSYPAVDAVWEREAERREVELKSGESKATPDSEAMPRLRARLKR